MSKSTRQRTRTLFDVAALITGADTTDACDQQQRMLQLTSLEDRLLFSATPVSPEMMEGESRAEVDEQPVHATEGDADQALQQDDLAGSAALDTVGSLNPVVQSDQVDGFGDEFILQWDANQPSDASGLSAIRRELVIVDTSTQDYQTLLDDLLASADDDRQFEVLLLDGSRDGVEQISDALSNHSELDALHLVTHGSEGRLKLGSSWLDANRLDGYAGDIAGWNDALRDGADLMIYGCDLAANAEGQSLIESLAAQCNCDVAASTDATGHASLGGDWDLEYAAGVVETGVAFSLQVQQEWFGLLAIQSYSDTFNDYSYANSHGSQDWSSNPWQEIGESDGHDAGEIGIENKFGEEVLRIEGDGRGIWREVDLSDAQMAFVQFSYYRVGMDLGDSVAFEISTDGGGMWNEIVRFDGPASDSGFTTVSYNIDPYIDSDTRIRFIATGMANANDHFYINDVQVNYLPEMVSTNEFQVNDETTSRQETSGDNRGSQRAVAVAGDGSYVVVWSSENQDATAWGVYARRFDSAGNALTGEILVNEVETGSEEWARVASDESGNFVVTWTSGHAGSDDVYARRFDSLGNAFGGEFRVNTTVANNQNDSKIAMDDSGDFVVVWEGAGGGEPSGIFYRRYDAAGTAIDATEQRANQVDEGSERDAAVAMNDAGDFVVVWDVGGRIKFQVFDSAGTPGATDEVYNNTVSSSPDVAMDAAGNFVVVYRWDNSFGKGVWGHQFDITGVEIAPWFRVGPGNLVVNKDHDKPSIAMDDGGDFIVTYETIAEEGPGKDIVVERFQSDTTSLGRTTINQTTTGDQHLASVAMLDLDNYVVAFTGEDADQTGVFARQFGTGTENLAPSVSLTNVVPSLAEDVDTSGSIKIADIVITDDATGTNLLSLSGTDAAEFEIVGTELHLRAGTTLDFESQSSYDVQVEVDDLTVGGTPDGTASHNLTITDANEAPTIALANVVTLMSENTDTSSAIKIADMVITDDALGSNDLTLSGADAARFEIVGTELRLRAGTSLDFETQASYDVTVAVDDSGVGGTPDDTAAYSLSLTDVNEVAMVSLTNTVPSLVEDTDTSSAIKIADIVISDDALGTNNLALSGADAASFEIVGMELRLRAGTTLDFEAKPSFDVTVQVDDTAVGGTPDDTAAHSLAISDANEVPTIALTNVVTLMSENTDTSSAIKIADIVITDDALGTNNLTLAGADAASFEIVGTELRLRAGTVLDFETQASFDVTVEVDDLAVGGTPDDTVAHSLSITDTNEAPTVALTNVVPSLAEDTDTSSAIKIADIVITDDALGTNSLSLSGADAASFEIVGTELRLRAGTALDFETQASFDVTVEVDDLAVVGTPDATTAHSLSITDTNELPTVSLTNVVASLAEDTDTSSAIKIADIVIADDAFGTNSLTLSGADAARFEIVGTELRLRAGTALDFETQASYDVTVEVDDLAVGGTPDDTVTHSLSITDTNEAPTVALTNVVPSLVEDTDTSSAIKIADIVITDDALGTNNLTLSGADAASFEIVGTELRLRAGTALDFESQASYDVTVEVDDVAVSGTPDATAAHSLSITNVNETPTVALTNVVPSLAEDTDTSSAIKIADIVITDDALGTNSLSLAGVDAASFEIVGTELRLRAGTALDFEAQASYDVTVEVDDVAVGGTPDATTAHSLTITDANEAPTVSLTNVVPSLAEDADTSSAIKIADIVITDDALGMNSLTLAGADAASFEIVGTELRLRAGTVLDFTTQASYDVTVEVDDLAVGGTPDATTAHSLSITDANGAPTVALTNVAASLAEDTDTSSAIKIADIVITDDALGTNSLSLSGADAARFEIVGTELRLRAGTALDFETQASFDVIVDVDDLAVGGSPDDSAAHSLLITDANDAPTVTLTNVVPSLNENADTSGAIRIADIAIADDALGTNDLTLAGADASRFEIVGTELRLRAGAALDFETQPALNVIVRVDDSSIGGSPDSSASHTLSIANANDAPVAGDDALTAIQGETMLLSAASLLANDTDIDLDSLQVLAITQPAHGMITLSASGTLTYTPDSDFFGVDSFAYTVADSSGATDTATVTVAVDPMGAVPPVTTTDVVDPVVEVDDESEEEEVDTTIELIPQHYQSDRSDNIRPLRLRVPSSSDLSVADSPIALLVSPRSTTHNLVATTAFFQRSDVIAHVSDIHTVLHSQLRNLAYIYSEGGFLSDLNSSTSEIYFEYPIHQWVAGSAVFASAGLSVGYVMWTIRGGYLLASMLSSIPAWAFVDPLPVLEYLDDSEQSKSGKDRGDDESLDSIIDEAMNLRSSDQDQNVEVYAS